LLAGSLLVAMLAVAVNAQVAPDAPRKGYFTPACARQDLRAIATIEESRERTGTPTELLAEAGQSHLQARILCLAGREEEGLALYESVITTLGTRTMKVETSK
jgi:hypothetical protein